MIMDVDNIWNFDLTRGYGNDPNQVASLLEAVSWVEYGKLGSQPQCTCNVIAAYCREINDLMTDIGRQKLKVFIPRLIGTTDTESRAARAEYLACQALRVFIPFWLDKADMKIEATQVRKFSGDLIDLRSLISTISQLSAHPLRLKVTDQTWIDLGPDFG